MTRHRAHKKKKMETITVVKCNLERVHCKREINEKLTVKSGCQRKPGKMLNMSTEGGQQNKFILTS